MGDALRAALAAYGPSLLRVSALRAPVAIAQRAFIIAAWAISAPYAIWLTVTL
jgi:hypothetical protein